MRNKVVKLQKAQGVSNYRLYADLRLNPGNFNAWLKHGDPNKVSNCWIEYNEVHKFIRLSKGAKKILLVSRESGADLIEIVIRKSHFVVIIFRIIRNFITGFVDLMLFRGYNNGERRWAPC